LFNKFHAEWDGHYNTINPWWMGYDPLHTSHQSNLYRKDSNYYKDFAVAPMNLPYVWCHPDGTYHLGVDQQSYVAMETAIKIPA
jgi:hypothetical protein